MTAIAAGIGHNGGPPLVGWALKPRLHLPKFDPWRILRPLKMFDGQFYPAQRIHMGGYGENHLPVKIVRLLPTTPQTDVTDLGSYTFSVDIGSAYAGRYLVVGALSQAAASGSPQWATCSIAGQSTPLFLTSASDLSAAIFGGYIPSGSGSQSIVIASAGGVFTAATVYVWEVQNVKFGLTFTNTATQATSTSATISTTVDVRAGGAAFGVLTDNAIALTYTWTGLTENSDPSASHIGTVASKSFISAQSGLTVSAAPSGSTVRRLLVAAVR